MKDLRMNKKLNSQNVIKCLPQKIIVTCIQCAFQKYIFFCLSFNHFCTAMAQFPCPFSINIYIFPVTLFYKYLWPATTTSFIHTIVCSQSWSFCDMNVYILLADPRLHDKDSWWIHILQSPIKITERWNTHTANERTAEHYLF